jgi:hypothetical protein
MQTRSRIERSGIRKNSDRPLVKSELLRFPLHGAIGAGALAAILWLVGTPARAQETGTDGTSGTAEKPTSEGAAELTLAQERVEKKYKEFEKVLARMAELTATTDPKRAALLRKAVSQSKEKLIGTQFEMLIDLLKQDRLANAVTNQREVEQDLNKLLELLLSEQRGQRLKDERKRIKEQIRRINELINREQELQNWTSKGADAKRLAESQGKLAKDTKKLANEMQEGAGDDARGDEVKADDENDEDGDKRSGGEKGEKGDAEKGDAKNDPSQEKSNDSQPE